MPSNSKHTVKDWSAHLRMTRHKFYKIDANLSRSEIIVKRTVPKSITEDEVNETFVLGRFTTYNFF